jgi:phosphohistidine phosphatase
MRHSTAEPDGPSDFDRSLSERGREDATAAGSWLADQGPAPDHVLVSAAVRAVQTWEAVAQGAGWDVEAELDRGLYAAGPETAIDLLRATPAEARALLVLGHNPTIATVATMLDAGEGDVDAANQMAMGYPAGALAVFELDDAWENLAEGTARLVAFHVPGA